MAAPLAAGLVGNSIRFNLKIQLAKSLFTNEVRYRLRASEQMFVEFNPVELEDTHFTNFATLFALNNVK